MNTPLAVVREVKSGNLLPDERGALVLGEVADGSVGGHEEPPAEPREEHAERRVGRARPGGAAADRRGVDADGGGFPPTASRAGNRSPAESCYTSRTPRRVGAASSSRSRSTSCCRAAVPREIHRRPLDIRASDQFARVVQRRFRRIGPRRHSHVGGRHGGSRRCGGSTREIRRRRRSSETRRSSSPQYDGSPKFEKIPGTNVSYATNTGAQIIQVGTKYYAADNGVWFVGNSPAGPWTVATEIPEQEDPADPAELAVYNVTHLHVYQSTPAVSTWGTRPGTWWSFPYYGVPVYGTGYYYPPYYGAYYYPRPPTWGFHVGYNPWTGWSFGVSWGGPFMRVGVGWSSGWGAWGGGYHRYGCCGGYYGGGYHAHYSYSRTTNINVNRRVSVRELLQQQPAAHDQRPQRQPRQHLQPAGEPRAQRGSGASGRAVEKHASSRRKANNVFADKDGNIARKTQQGWEARGEKGWEKPRPRGFARRPTASTSGRQGRGRGRGRSPRPPESRRRSTARTSSGRTPRVARPSPTQARQRVDSADLNRSAAARQRGATRTASRPPTTKSKPAARPAPSRAAQGRKK